MFYVIKLRTKAGVLQLLHKHFTKRLKKVLSYLATPYCQQKCLKKQQRGSHPDWKTRKMESIFQSRNFVSPEKWEHNNELVTLPKWFFTNSTTQESQYWQLGFNCAIRKELDQ